MPPTSTWTKCPRARTIGVYWRRRGSRIEYGFLRPLGNVEYVGPVLQDALDARNQALLDHSAGKPSPNRRLTIRDLADELREMKRGRIRPSSFAALEHTLDKLIIPELGHFRPRAITHTRLFRFNRKLEAEGKSGATIKRYTSPLHQILELAIRHGCIETNPMDKLTRDERPIVTRKEQYVWSLADIQALLDAADAFDRRKDAVQSYAPLVWTLVYTGMRISEALGLRWGDIDLLGNRLRVSGSYDRKLGLSETKTDAGRREISLADPLVVVLLAHKPVDATDEQFVFPAIGGKGPMSYWNFRTRAFAPIVKIAGLDGHGITPHSLRHANASRLIARGISDTDVAAHLGHASPNTTRAIYAHVFDSLDAHERIREALGS